MQGGLKIYKLFLNISVHYNFNYQYLGNTKSGVKKLKLLKKYIQIQYITLIYTFQKTQNSKWLLQSTDYLHFFFVRTKMLRGLKKDITTKYYPYKNPRYLIYYYRNKKNLKNQCLIWLLLLGMFLFVFTVSFGNSSCHSTFKMIWYTFKVTIALSPL